MTAEQWADVKRRQTLRRHERPEEVRDAISDRLKEIFLDEAGADYRLFEDLYPTCRSITGNGVRETLRRIGQRVPHQLCGVLDPVVLCQSTGEPSPLDTADRLGLDFETVRAAEEDLVQDGLLGPREG